MKRKARGIAIVCAAMMILTGCSEKTSLQDGYYTAQAAQFSHGWREYITIMVKGGSIVSVEYNAENASGFIKSWDNAYMQNMYHEYAYSTAHIPMNIPATTRGSFWRTRGTTRLTF